MPVPFPYPNESINNTMGLLQHANVLADGFLGTAILIIIGVVSFMITKNFSSDKAFGFSAFLLFLSAIMLRFMSLINDGVMYIVIVLFAGVLVWLWYLRDEESV